MKPDKFDLKSFPAYLLQIYSLHHIIISPHMLLNRKKHRKQFLSEEIRDEIKPNEISHT